MRATILFTGFTLALANFAEAHADCTSKPHVGLLKRTAVTCGPKQYKLKNACHPCADRDAASCNSKGALSCSKLFLRGTACVAAKDCGRRFYADKTSKTCKRCTDPLALTCTADAALTCSNKFLSNGKCVTQSACPQNTFAHARTHTCRSCKDPDAIKCTSTAALSCATKYLSNGACVASCPSKTYQDAKARTCKPCEDPLATTCTAEDALTCANAFLYKGDCVSSCPPRFFGDKKGNACLACTNTGATKCADADVDITCGLNDAGVQTYLDPSTSTCVSARDCSAGTYASPDTATAVCLSCPGSGAATCDIDGTTKTCSTGYFKDGACLETCPSRFRGNDDDHVCAPCADGALTCDANGELSCGDNSKGQPTYLDVPAAACVLTCDVGTYTDAELRKCTVCPGAGAATCDSTGTTTSCTTGYLSKGACVDACPTSTYAADSDKTCKACEDGALSCDADKSLTCGPNAEDKATFLSSGKCLVKCPSRFFADSASYVCSACSDGALTCSSATDALTCGKNAAGSVTFLNAALGSCVAADACPTATYPKAENSVCTPCGEGAASCDANGLALSCDTGLYLTSSGTCVTAANCPVSTYPRAGTQATRRRALVSGSVCAACEDGALKCTATYSTSCGLNKAGKQTYLLNGHCVLKNICPDWSYADDTTFVCRRCSTLAPGSTTCDAKGALTCGPNSAGAQLYLTPNQNCVLPAQCPQSTFVDTSKTACTLCDDGVTSCTGSGAGKASACGRTEKGVSLFLNPSNTCVPAASCPSTYYADDATSTCTRCDDGETSCTGNGSGDALTCGLNSKNVQTYLNPDNDCVVAESCPPAYFGDAQSFKCVQCDAGEASCTFAGPGGATSCAKNDAGAQLYLDASGECVTAPDCPAATFVNDEDHTCTACADGALICTSKTDASLCGINKAGNAVYLDDGLCVEVDKCTAGTWPDSELFVCRDCELIDSDANTCTPTDALTCKTLYAYHGDCVARPQCGSDTYVDNSARSCTPCSTIVAGAATCTKDAALSCLPGTFFFNGACPTSCPTGYFADSSKNVCSPCSVLDGDAATCTKDKVLSCRNPSNIIISNQCVSATRYAIFPGYVLENYQDNSLDKYGGPKPVECNEALYLKFGSLSTFSFSESGNYVHCHSVFGETGHYLILRPGLTDLYTVVKGTCANAKVLLANGSSQASLNTCFDAEGTGGSCRRLDNGQNCY